MERLAAIFTRRLGPLPVWVWAAVAAGGIVIYAYVRQRQGRLAVAPVASPEDAPADAGDINGISGGGQNGDGERELTFSSNQAWARYVVDKLTIRGEDPIKVQNALNKVIYAVGATVELTAVEAALWNESVRLYGSPPEAVPVIVIKQTPNPPPDPDPTPTPTPIPTHVSAPANQNLYDWVSGLNATYSGLNTSFTRIFGVFKNDPTALNPDARNHMTWLPGPAGSNYKVPVFRSGRSIRIK